MIIVSPLLILLGAALFVVFVIPYWWVHYGPEGQSVRAWVPGLLVIVACIAAVFAWVVIR